MSKLLERARELQVGTPATVTTPYVNTIPPEEEPWFPGDEDIERRIRAYIRWNAAVMVVKANKHADGIGGHLSTFASSAALYEVGFNHFFRGKDDGLAGDHVYIQGHAAPGIYARAFLEGRLTEDAARPLPPGDRRQRPVAATRTPGSCPTSGSTRRCRWASARSTRSTTPASTATCTTGASTTPAAAGCGASSATASATSPRPSARSPSPPASSSTTSSGSSTATCSASTARSGATARSSRSSRPSSAGAGWNVIKVIWGSKWDELLARDVDGVLLNKMNTTVDGEFQRYAVESGAYIREHFFGPDPRLRKMVEHLSDDELRNLPRGGHDYRKLYAAYKAATEQDGRADGDPGQDHQGLDARPRRRGPQRHPPDQEDDERPAARCCATGSTSATQIPEEALADDKEPPLLPAAEGSVEHAVHDRPAPGARRAAAPPGGPHRASP